MTYTLMTESGHRGSNSAGTAWKADFSPREYPHSGRPYWRCSAFGIAGAHVRNRTEATSIRARRTPSCCVGKSHRGHNSSPRCSQDIHSWRCSVTLRDDLLARQVSGLPHPSPQVREESNLVGVRFGIEPASSPRTCSASCGDRTRLIPETEELRHQSHHEANLRPPEPRDPKAMRAPTIPRQRLLAPGARESFQPTAREYVEREVLARSANEMETYES